MAIWDKLLSSKDKDEKKAKELWDRAINYFDGKLYNRALKDLQEAPFLVRGRHQGLERGVGAGGQVARSRVLGDVNNIIPV